MPNEETINNIHYSFNEIMYSIYAEKKKKEKGLIASDFIYGNPNKMNKEVKSPKIIISETDKKNVEQEELLKEFAEQYKREAFRTFFETGDEYIRITVGGRYHFAEIEYNFIAGETKYSSNFLSPIEEQVFKDLSEQKIIKATKMPYSLCTIIISNSMYVKAELESSETAEGNEEKGSQRKRGKNVSKK